MPNLKKLILVPYKLGSHSAKVLAHRLSELLPIQVKRVRKDSETFKQKLSHVYLNWGNSAFPSWFEPTPTKWINGAFAVQLASNKADTFKILKNAEINIPEFTFSKEEANGWYNDGSRVVCRTLLTGHSGAGIILVSAASNIPLVDAPLYVKYYPKECEYRVHVFDGQVIDVQQKRRRTDYDGEVDMQVRNHQTGWVYCRNSYNPPVCIDQIKEQCVKSVKALGLDFGAVDVIYSKKHNKFWILEVNTAPGMEGTTVEIYANAIKTFLEKL